MIVVHSGKAHKDDFLATCVVLAHLGAGVPVYRRDCQESDLLDEKIWVLDQGRKFDPELRNFDHHHIKENICAFTMVLDFLTGVEYREWFPWARFIETFDAGGPKEVTKLTGVQEDSFRFFECPLAGAMINLFSKESQLVWGDSNLYEVMYSIGRSILDKIGNTKKDLADLDRNGRLFSFEDVNIFDTRKCNVEDSETDPPTKIWEQSRGVHIDVIFALNKRGGERFRVVSTNTDRVAFRENTIPGFVHNSGFLRTFDNEADLIGLVSSARKA